MRKESIFVAILILSLFSFVILVSAYTIQDFANSISQLFSNTQNASIGGFDFFQWVQNLFQPLASSCCNNNGDLCSSCSQMGCSQANCNSGVSCGDGVCTPNLEDCGTCRTDCPCPTGYTCPSHQCVKTSSSSSSSTSPGTKPPCPYQCCTPANDPSYQSKSCTQGLCSNHQCTYTCSDSDGGDNPASAGTCNSWAGSYSDACSGGTTFLQEQYCEPGSQTPTCMAKTYNCITYCTGLGYGSGSCSSGACHCQGTTSSTTISTSCVDACLNLGHYTGSACSGTCSSGWIPAPSGNQACSPNICCCYVGTSSSSSSSSSSSPPPEKCGNGVVDSGEACDTGRTGYCEGCKFRCHPYNVKEVCNAECSGYCSGYADTGCSYQDSGVCDKNCGSDDKCAGKKLGDTCDASVGGICSACKCTAFGKSCAELCNGATASCNWYSCPSNLIPQPLGDNYCQNAGIGNKCCCGAITTSTTSTTTTTPITGVCCCSDNPNCANAQWVSKPTNMNCQTVCLNSEGYYCSVSKCSSAPTSSTTTSNPGSISGTVIDANSQKPVQNAVVAAGNFNSEGSAVTDSSGRFSITNLNPGTYSVAVEASLPYLPQVLAGVTVQSGKDTLIPPIALSQVSPIGSDQISIGYNFKSNQVLSILVGNPIQGKIRVDDNPNGFVAPISSAGKASLITFAWNDDKFVGVYTGSIQIK